MKDYFGNELSIGDSVAFIAVGYRDFAKGIVLGFTEQQVRIRYPSCHKHDPSYRQTTRYPAVIIKEVK